jgi:two-component system response regulator EvgA
MGRWVRDNRHAVTQTVLIVDDHASFRVSATRVLECAGYDVIGAARDGQSAIAAARDLCPDVVVLDVELPDIDGFEVARRLAVGDYAPAVILTSSRDSSEFGGIIAGSGARGFLPKGELSGPALAALLK